MLNQAKAVSEKQIPPTACYKLRISYFNEADVVTIEHYSDNGVLLSEARLSPEDALDYAKSITDVVDQALGIE